MIATLFFLQRIDRPILYILNQDFSKNILVENHWVSHDLGIEVGVYESSTTLH